MACGGCGVRTEVILHDGARGTLCWMGDGALVAGHEHVRVFGDDHAGCAATAGVAPLAWPETMWGVPAALPQDVAYRIDDALHDLMDDVLHQDKPLRAAWRLALVRLADQTYQWARRPLVLTGPGVEAEIRGWWHEHLRDAVASVGGELLAVVIAECDGPKSEAPDGELVLGRVQVITATATFEAVLAAPSCCVVQDAPIELAWQPVTVASASIDGLFAVTLD